MTKNDFIEKVITFREKNKDKLAALPFEQRSREWFPFTMTPRQFGPSGRGTDLTIIERIVDGEYQVGALTLRGLFAPHAPFRIEDMYLEVLRTILYRARMLSKKHTMFVRFVGDIEKPEWDSGFEPTIPPALRKVALEELEVDLPESESVISEDTGKKLFIKLFPVTGLIPTTADGTPFLDPYHVALRQAYRNWGEMGVAHLLRRTSLPGRYLGFIKESDKSSVYPVLEEDKVAVRAAWVLGDAENILIKKKRGLGLECKMSWIKDEEYEAQLSLYSSLEALKIVSGQLDGKENIELAPKHPFRIRILPLHGVALEKGIADLKGEGNSGQLPLIVFLPWKALETISSDARSMIADLRGSRTRFVELTDTLEMIDVMMAGALEHVV